MKIAVVILNYNGEKLLPQFLPSVIQHSPIATVIVADNASTDNSISLLEKEFPQVGLIKLDENYGFCGGYNKALKQIEAEYYVLLNSDVEVTANWLEPMVELLDQDNMIGAVQPKILAWHQKDYFEYAGAAGGFIDLLGYPFCRGRLFENLEKDEGQYNDVREVFWATGACLMIRANLYNSVGGLDDDFFAHMEEIDLCWRIQRSGKKVFYTGKSKVFHVGAGTLSRSNPRKTYYNFRNGLSLILKNTKTSSLLIKFPIRLLLDYLAVLLFTVKGDFKNAKAVFGAHRDFFKGMPKTLKKREYLKNLPFTANSVYRGVIVLDYFLLGKRKIKI